MKKLKPGLLTALTGICTLFTILTSCNSGNTETENSSAIMSIDLVEAYANRKEVPLSAIAKSVEYVALETTEESLISNAPLFQITDHNIIVSANKQVLAFDKSSGDFIKELGTLGEGPDEYMQTDKYFDESTGYTYVRASNGTHMGLDADGRVKQTFKTPSSDSTLVMGYTKINDSTFVGFHGNYNCNQKYKLIFFNESGKETQLIPYHEKCLIEDANSFFIFLKEGIFAKSQQQTFFKETYNDTLFQIVDTNLVPEIVFNSRNKAIPYEEKLMYNSPESKLEIFETRLVDVSAHHIFFQLTTQGQTFNGVFNRETGETLLSDIGRTEMHGFVNDLDNFLPLVPQYVNDQNQLIGYLEAPDVLNWFKENPEKAARLPANLKKLGEIEPDDNPVVMIVDLKD